MPRSLWRSSDSGRRRAASISVGLRALRVGRIWSSHEPKAVETANALADTLGIPTQIADGLEEHHRNNTPFFQTSAEFEAVIERFFARPRQLVFGEETAQRALHRFSTAAQRAAKAEQGDCAIVTHRTVMTLFAASVSNMDPMHLWRRLGMPSLITLTLPTMRLADIRLESVVECIPASGEGTVLPFPTEEIKRDDCASGCPQRVEPIHSLEQSDE